MTIINLKQHTNIIYLTLFLFMSLLLLNLNTLNADAKSLIKPYSQPTQEDILPTELREKYDKAIADGKTLIGLPYKMGGSDRNKWLDCSHFVYEVYKTAGINYGGYKTSSGLYAMADKITTPAPGDLVFFSSGGGSITHVSVYLGNGMLLHASGKKANISPIKGWSWEKIFVGFGRLPQLNGDYKKTDAKSDYSKGSSGGASSDSADSQGTSKEEKKSSVSGGKGTYQWLDPYKDQNVANSVNVGLTAKDLKLPSEWDYLFLVTSNFILSMMKYVMVAFSLIAICAVALQIMVYVLIVQGGNSNKIVDGLEKYLFGESLTFDKYIKHILYSSIVVCCAIAFVLGSYYMVTQYAFYKGLIYIINLFL